MVGEENRLETDEVALGWFRVWLPTSLVMVISPAGGGVPAWASNWSMPAWPLMTPSAPFAGAGASWSSNRVNTSPFFDPIFAASEVPRMPMVEVGVLISMASTPVLAICPETKVKTPVATEKAPLPSWVPGS